MRIKHSWNYGKAALCAIVAYPLLAMEGVAVVYLVQKGDWGDLASGLKIISLSCLFLMFAVPILPALLPIGLIRRERFMRETAHGDGQVAPVASKQPDTTLALAPGQALVLSRTAVHNVAQQIVLVFVFAAFMPFLGIVSLMQFLPSINAWMADILFDPEHLIPAPPPPSPFEWAILGLPIALGVVPAAWLIWHYVSERKQAITADDRGVTLHRTLRRPRFIPWDDILVFVKWPFKLRREFEGNYWLGGRRHWIEFGLYGPLPEFAGSTSRSTTYEYEGGFDAYAVNAERLMATIVARSYTPLHIKSSSTDPLKSLRKLYPAGGLTADQVNAMPLAGSPRQPMPQATGDGATSDRGIVLRPRLPFAPMLGEALIWFGALMAFFLIFEGATQRQQILSGDVSALISLGIAGPFFAALAYAFALRRRRKRLPTVIADSVGLRRETGEKASSVSIPWSAVRAWGIQESAMAAGKITFAVFADDQGMVWTESPDAELAGRGISGDRRFAYRSMAEALHATIATYTSLPLHEIPAELDIG